MGKQAQTIEFSTNLGINYIPCCSIVFMFYNEMNKKRDMEQKIIEILKDNFKGQNIDRARKELCFFFCFMRSDSPKCTKCGNENYAELDSVGDYWQEDRHNGSTYVCKKCDNEFDFPHYA